MEGAGVEARIRELEKQVRERDREIAGTKRAVQLLQRAVDALPYPLTVVNCKDCTVEFGNTSSGFSPERGPVTCHALSHHTPGPCESSEHPCPLEIITRTRKPATVEHIHFKGAHSAEVVEVQAFPLFGAEGEVERMVELTFNVTALRRREQRLKESAMVLAKLNVATSRLMHARDVKGACHVALRAAHDLFGPAVCAVAVTGTRETDLIATSSIDEVDQLPELDDANLQQAQMPAGQVLLFENRAKMPPRWRDIPGAAWAVVCGVSDLGNLLVIGTSPEALWSRRLALLQNLAEKLTETTRRLRRNTQLEVAVAIDPLTGAYSRAVLQQVLERETRAAIAREGHVSVAMVDVDDFKQINDRHGHQCGDRVLQKVAAVIMSELRAPEMPIRYGGDEFLLVLPATIQHASCVVERIAQQIERHNELRTFEITGHQISLSIGLAQWQPNTGQHISDAIAEADGRMYAQKRARQLAPTEQP